MKNIILIIIGVMISVYTLGTCLEVVSLEVRKNALEVRVSGVLQQTLEENFGKTDEASVREQLQAALTPEVGTNGRVEVEITGMNLQKGLIQVVVREYFRQFNGRERSIQCHKTVIVEQEMEREEVVAGQIIGNSWKGTLHYSVGTSSSTYTNAYEYYQEYEGKMRFKPEDDIEAGVYYGTVDKKSSTSNIVYRTLGWRVTVRDKAGAVIDQVYYALNGEHLKVVDTRDVDGYKYRLYNLTLDNIKSRLSSEANEALKKADCSIVFDACLTVKRYGEIKGGMSDDGIEWGKVYTTYEGIVNAENWSKKTRESLKSHFNKEIADMFYEVKLSGGEGISAVSGGGKYCYGTEITIEATPQKGYQFLEWTGGIYSASQKYTFTVYEDVTIKATTRRTQVAINFYRNLNYSDTTMETKFYTIGEGPYLLQDYGWQQDGYHQTGWSTSRVVVQAYFGTQESVAEDWLERVSPRVDLYAAWEPNRYRIVYMSNGAEEEKRSISCKYTDTITLPQDGFTYADGKLGGWSIQSGPNSREYRCGQEVSVAELAAYVGVAHRNNATIYLYAQKDGAPVINTEAIYVSLWDAKCGNVTEEFLSKHTRITDDEDGQIPYGVTEKGMFLIRDFDGEKYRDCEGEQNFTEQFYVSDSAGNEVYRDVVVHVVEDVLWEQKPQTYRIRFISETYYKDANGNPVSAADGGLAENSIWRLNPEYASLLEELFQ